MIHKSFSTEILLASTAVGLVATCSAPWIELRGTYAAWRITEWHAFWRGAGAYQLADVVAPDYPIPIEFATTSMQNSVSGLVILGVVLAAWHVVAACVLLLVGARRRLSAADPWPRVALQVGAILLVSGLALYLLSVLFALPSSLSLKVDFRSPTDIHTDSLIWSNVDIFPVAPALSIVAALAEFAVLVSAIKRRRAT